MGIHYYSLQDRSTKANIKGFANSLYSDGPSIEVRCAKEWGTDYRMRDFCVRNQREARARGGW